MSLISHSSPIRTRSTEGPGLKPHLLAGDPIFHYHTWSSFPEAPFLGGIDIIDIKKIGDFKGTWQGVVPDVLLEFAPTSFHVFPMLSEGSRSPSDLRVSSADKPLGTGRFIAI